MRGGSELNERRDQTLTLPNALHKRKMLLSTVPRAKRPDATLNKTIVRITAEITADIESSGRFARGTLLVASRLG